MAEAPPTPSDAEPTGRHEPWWASTTFAAGVTAVCTVLVAFAAFLSAAAASDSDDNYATASLALTDANFFFEQGVDALSEELAAEGSEFDRVCLLALVTDAADDLCDGAGELGDLADDPVLDAGFASQAAADEAFAVGLEKSTASVDYQAALVLFAVGLALSAWASLSDMAKRSRVVFLALSLASVIVGLVRLVTV